MGLRAGDVPGQAPTLRIGKLRIVGGEVRADDLPAVPPVVAPEEAVPPKENSVAVVRRQAKGGGPVEPEELPVQTVRILVPESR